MPEGNNDVLVDVSRQVAAKYYGKYRGFVTDNADPDKRGRLKVRVPSVLGTAETSWALPCVPFGGKAGHGFFMIPEVDAQVWVEFEEGDPSLPIWTGTFWQQSSDVPSEATAQSPPTTRLVKTVSGHLLQFDDKSGSEKFTLKHPTGTSAVIDDKGTVTLTDAGGNTVTLDADNKKITVEDANGNKIEMAAAGITVTDANNNKVEMAAAGVTVESSAQVVIKASMVQLGGAGGEPLIKGTSFMTAFNTHIHTCTAPGSPTSPPAVPMLPTQLSTKVMTA